MKASEPLDQLVRKMLTDTLRRSKRSREQVADAISELVGYRVSKRALDSFTSEASDQNRFPLQLLGAFCEATGDWTLLNAVVEAAGFTLAGPLEQEEMRIGRAYIRKVKAEAELAEVALG